MIEKEKYRQRLQGIRAFVFDSDGVISQCARPLPGAETLFRLLEQRGIPRRIMTNSSYTDGAKKHAVYREMNFCIGADEIIGCASVLPDYLAQHPLRSPRVWACGNANPTAFLESLGLIHDNKTPLEELGAFILLDDDFTWDTNRVAEVFNKLLQDPEIPLIVPNPDFLYPIRKGEFFPTSGAPAAWIRELLAWKGVDIEPVYFGKPHHFLYHKVFASLSRVLPDLRPDEVAMVGDSPAVDIKGANRAGWHSILVETGNHRLGAKDPDAQPQLRIPGLPQLIELLATDISAT